MNAKKILIVEDDKMLCTIFQMFIQELNYEIVATVRTGEDAVAACDTYSDIDVILMDIHLDGNIDGVETAKIIAQKYKTPIIFITGDSSPSTIEAATLQNVYGFMTKPVYKRNLGVAIEYAFAKYRKG
ncbi:MAG: response regulator [Bacteroidales bacterium]|nr:response regulator [Bacteroidales bacterium]MBR4215846.1 response regulator [Bacteroidales bacterium]